MHPSAGDAHRPQAGHVHIVARLQVVDETPAVINAQPQRRAAQVERELSGVVARRGRHLAQRGVEVREVGLPLAEAGYLWRGHREPAPTKGHPEILVIAVGRHPLLAVLPETDDVFDPIPVTVEGQDNWQRSGLVLR